MGEVIKYIKITMVGSSESGKSALLDRFCTPKNQPFNFKPYAGRENTLDIKPIFQKQYSRKLCIFDLVGFLGHQSISRAYYPETDAFILSLDLTDKNAFKNHQYWLNEIKEFGRAGTPILLVCTKSDLPQIITDAEIDDFCKKHKLTHIKTNAKNDDNVENAFNLAAKMATDFKYKKDSESEQKRMIAKKLNDYVKSVRDHGRYTYGFTFFKSIQSNNRYKNCAIAENLANALTENSASPLSLEAILNEHIPTRLGPCFFDKNGHGIRSPEMIRILKEAQSLIANKPQTSLSQRLNCFGSRKSGVNKRC